MATLASDDEKRDKPASNPDERNWGPVICAALIVAVLLVFYGEWPGAAIYGFTFTGAAFAGFLAAGHRGSLSKEWLKHCIGGDFKLSMYKDNFTKDGCRAPHFLNFVSGAIAFYVFGYAVATQIFVERARSLAQDALKTTQETMRQQGASAADIAAVQAAPVDDTPIHLTVVVMTAVSILVTAYFVVHYAAYIRALNFLDQVLDRIALKTAALRDAADRHGRAAGGSRDDGEARRLGEELDDLQELGRELRNSVARMEQMFEPPGNLFVTLGLAATFLGLAAGLVLLDPLSVGRAATDAVSQGKAALTGLESFIGCMGLALGASMLGVLVSMAAQWLRGYGPAQSTDDLLARAMTAIQPISVDTLLADASREHARQRMPAVAEIPVTEPQRDVRQLAGQTNGAEPGVDGGREHSDG